MRIAYIINSMEGGGAALPIPAIADVLRRCGAEICVFALTRRDGRAARPIAESGLELKIRDGGEKDHWAALDWLTRELAAFAPDIVWTSLTRATLLGQRAAKRLGVPVVSWQHNAYLKPVNSWLLRRTRNDSRLWVGDSQSVTDLTAARLSVGKSQLMTWPIFRAEASGPPARRWRPGETIRIGSLGRLHRAKGYDVLIEALRILERDNFQPAAPFEVAIAGEGSQREELEKLARDAGLSCLRLNGYESDPAHFLSTLHVYVQPSRREGFCIASHQAMAAGLPIIASEVGELKNTIVEDVTGLLVPVADSDALASALASLLSDPAWLGPMGDQARARVLKRFGADRFDAAGKAIYERMLTFSSSA